MTPIDKAIAALEDCLKDYLHAYNSANTATIVLNMAYPERKALEIEAELLRPKIDRTQTALASLKALKENGVEERRALHVTELSAEDLAAIAASEVPKEHEHLNAELGLGRLLKIIRNGERFWLRNVRTMDGKLYGQVDNAVTEQAFSQGKIIEFSEDEIIEEWQEPPPHEALKESVGDVEAGWWRDENENGKVVLVVRQHKDDKRVRTFVEFDTMYPHETAFLKCALDRCLNEHLLLAAGCVDTEPEVTIGPLPERGLLQTQGEGE